jgi:hypothetical protein
VPPFLFLDCVSREKARYNDWRMGGNGCGRLQPITCERDRRAERSFKRANGRFWAEASEQGRGRLLWQAW